MRSTEKLRRELQGGLGEGAFCEVHLEFALYVGGDCLRQCVFHDDHGLCL